MDKRAVAVLSTSNLIHNLNVIKSYSRGAKIIAMVKANAYGHGIRSVSLRIAPLVDMLGVASVEEAMILRAGLNIKTPIVLMQGVLEQYDLILASNNDLDVVLHNYAQLDWFLNLGLKQKLRIWIKVNTGLGRLGFPASDIYKVYEDVSKSNNVLEPVRIMSHFACADDPHHELNYKQIGLFQNIVDKVDTEFSLCNSAGIFNFPDYVFNYVRPGLALYGASPVLGRLASDYDLRPVMTVSTILTSIQKFKKGDYIGYGGLYVCPEDMLVGIASFGYGDGYPMNNEGKAQVLLNDKLCSVIGKVSMDMIAVDLRECLNAKVGDKVILWGEGLPVEALASQTHNSPYNLLTGVQNRVKFIWQ